MFVNTVLDTVWLLLFINLVHKFDNFSLQIESTIYNASLGKKLLHLCYGSSRDEFPAKAV